MNSYFQALTALYFDISDSDNDIVYEPPMFVERFEEQNVPQNGTIRLPARVVGNPEPEIEWLHNNVTMRPSEKVKSSFDGERIELIIFNADSEVHSGNYKCIASNVVGKASHGARVTVDVDKVYFTKKLKKTTTVEESKTITLECETSHTVSTEWFYQNKELSGMDHRVVVQDGRIHKLIIKNTSVHDAGLYRCIVKDQETECNVKVLEAQPEFIRKIEDFEAKERELIILEVEVTSETAEVAWYKDGNRLEEDKKKVTFVNKGRTRKLLIREASVHDEGEYTCVLADQECSAEVTVTELAPELLKRMEDVTIAKGEKAMFEIELTKGDALVRWFYNKEDLQFSDHIQLSIDGKRQKLKIYNSKVSDSGEYSCTVGEQISTAILTVEEPIVEFVRRLPDITLVTKKSEAVFEVELSQSVEVKWYKNNTEIFASEKYALVTDKKIRKLILLNAEQSDVDTYTCVACNVKTSSMLKVEVIKMPPTILENDKVYRVKQNDDITLTVKFNATPQPEAEWTVSKKIIKKSARLQPTVDEHSASLTIKKVVDNDEGQYTIKLKNDCGEAEASLNLIIMSMYFDFMM